MPLSAKTSAIVGFSGTDPGILTSGKLVGNKKIFKKYSKIPNSKIYTQIPQPPSFSHKAYYVKLDIGG